MRKTPQRNFVTGFDSLSQSVIVKKRLALEYNGSSGTVCVVEWGYSEAHSFSNEADWYISTIALDYWFSIHGHFFIVDSIGVFTNSHNDDFVFVFDSYGTIIVIISYGSIESFSERTNRNHGSPCTVNIWSCIHFEELLVNNILGRTNGHGYFVMSSDVNIAKVVFKSSCVQATVTAIFNGYYDISGSVIRSINSDCAAAITYVIINAFYINLRIFIALVCYISGNDFTSNLCTSAIFFNDFNGYFVVFVNWTFNWVKFKAKSVVRINNSQFSPNSLMYGLRSCNNFNRSTNQRCISFNISLGCKSIVCDAFINNSFTIAAKIHIICGQLDTIFINVNWIDSDSLTESYFISDINRSIGSMLISSSHVQFEALSSTIISYIEGGNCTVSTQERNTNLIFTRSQIGHSLSSRICASIGVNQTINSITYFIQIQIACV